MWLLLYPRWHVSYCLGRVGSVYHGRPIPGPTLLTKPRGAGGGEHRAIPPGACRLHCQHHHNYQHHHHCQRDDHVAPNQSAGRAASWSKDFDSLLADPIGLHRFTDFLQQEFRWLSFVVLMMRPYCPPKDLHKIIKFWNAWEQNGHDIDDGMCSLYFSAFSDVT